MGGGGGDDLMRMGVIKTKQLKVGDDIYYFNM